MSKNQKNNTAYKPTEFLSEIQWNNQSITDNNDTIIGWINKSIQRRTPINPEPLYYSVVMLNRTTGNWEMAKGFGTSVSVAIIPADPVLIEDSRLVILGGYKAKVYGNISISDKLIVSNRAGVLTNARNLQVTSRQYVSGSWQYVDLPVTSDPEQYNTYDTAQGVHATVAAIALESYNSSSTGIIEVKVLNT